MITERQQANKSLKGTTVERINWTRIIRTPIVLPITLGILAGIADTLPGITQGNTSLSEIEHNLRGIMSVSEENQFRYSQNRRFTSFVSEKGSQFQLFIFDLETMFLDYVDEAKQGDSMHTPSSDGRYIAFVSEETDVNGSGLRVFDREEGSVVFESELTGPLTLLAWTHDGRLAIGHYTTSAMFESSDGHFQTIDVTDGSRGMISAGELLDQYS